MHFGVPRECALPAERANYRHLVQDVAWFGLAFAATSRFLSIYAIRLGATPLELGLISSLPAIVLLFSSGLAGWWLKKTGNNLSKALLWPGFGFRLLFLLPALAPFLPERWQAAWLIVSVTLPAIPQGIASIAFMVTMRQAIDNRHMTSLISHRQLALNVCVGLAALTFGLWLEQAPFPFNYQAMFALAFLFSLISQRHCLQVRSIQQQEALNQETQPVASGARPQPSDSPWRSPRFLRVVLVVLASHISFTAIVSITPLHLMQNLGATEGFMALFGLAELVAGATITLFTNRIVARIGNQALIAIAMIGTALAAMLIALAPSLPLTLLAAAFSGASWTAVGVGIYGFFNDNAPTHAMASYSIAYQQAIGLGLFIGPMIGSTLVNSGAEIVLVVLAGAAMRLAAGALIEHGIFTRLMHPQRRPAPVIRATTEVAPVSLGSKTRY
jgi:MFS family permease